MEADPVWTATRMPNVRTDAARTWIFGKGRRGAGPGLTLRELLPGREQNREREAGAAQLRSDTLDVVGVADRIGVADDPDDGRGIGRHACAVLPRNAHSAHAR